MGFDLERGSSDKRDPQGNGLSNIKILVMGWDGEIIGGSIWDFVDGEANI